MARERRLVGGRDYQALVDSLKEALDQMRQAVDELKAPNLPGDYRQRWAGKGETAYGNGLKALWEIESIGRSIKRGRLTSDEGGEPSREQ